LKVRAGKGLHEGMQLDVALNNYQFNGKKRRFNQVQQINASEQLRLPNNRL